jgi:hypothetical protein
MTEIGELLPVLPDIALHIIRTVSTTQTVILCLFEGLT